MAKVQSVPGISCLYYYPYRDGSRRYFVKVQCNNKIIHQNLDILDKPTFKQLKKSTEQTVRGLKHKHHSGRSFEAWLDPYIIVRQLCPKTTKSYRSILRQFSLNDDENAKVLQEIIQSGKNCCQILRTVNCFFK